MDQQAREHLHQVLSCMLESEAKRYYQLPEEERADHAYGSARALMQHFEFEDLLEADTASWQTHDPHAPEDEQ